MTKITRFKRTKLHEKEEQLRVTKIYYELCNRESQIKIKGKGNDSVYLMKIIESMLKNKLSAQQQVRRKIKK